MIRLVRFSGPGTQVLHGAALDPQGHIYVVGEYDGELELDGTPMAQSTTRVPFVYKFCPNGQLEWARHGVSSTIAPHLFSPDLYRFAIAADASGAYVTGRLLGDVEFPEVEFPNFSLMPPMDVSAFVARFDAEGAHATGVVLYEYASAGLDIAVDGDEVFVVGICNALRTPAVTGALLAKLTTALDIEEEYCIPGGQGSDDIGSAKRTLARSLTLRPGEPTFVIGGTLVLPMEGAEAWGDCAEGLVNNRNGFVAAVSRDPSDWAATDTLWDWCRVFATESPNDIVLDTAMSDQAVVAALASDGGVQALAACPSEPPPDEVISLATLDGNGVCTHAEWFQGTWGQTFLFSVAAATLGDVLVTGRLSSTLDVRDVHFEASNSTFFGARMPPPPSQAVSWYIRAKHDAMRRSGGIHVTANEKSAVFIGYAMGNVELEAGGAAIGEVGSANEAVGGGSEAYDAFLLLVRP